MQLCTRHAACINTQSGEFAVLFWLTHEFLTHKYCVTMQVFVHQPAAISLGTTDVAAEVLS